MKKLLSLFTVGVLMLSLLSPFSLSAAEVTEGSLGGDTYWKFDEETGELTVYGTGATGDFYKITRHEDRSITSLPAPEFEHLIQSITSVIVEDGITELGYELFKGLTNCQSITLPQTLLVIGTGAFSHCTSIQTINLPDSLVRIDPIAFYNCDSLDSIVWPSQTKTIESSVFASCENLIEFEIPNTVTTLKAFAPFCNIKSLFVHKDLVLEDYAFDSIGSEEIIFEEGTTQLPPLFSGNPNLKRIIIPQSVSSIERGLFGTYIDTNVQICYSGTEAQWEKILNGMDPEIARLTRNCNVITNYVISSEEAPGSETLKTDDVSTTTNADKTEEKHTTGSNSGTTDVGSSVEIEKNNNGILNKNMIVIIGSVATTIILAVIFLVITTSKNIKK